MNILIVEKRNTPDRKLEQLLQQNGYIVYATHDARSAKNMMTSGWAQLVVFDRVMTAAAQTADIRNAMLMMPIVVLTDMQSKKLMIDALESGADDVIETPCDSDIILSRMRAVQRRAAYFKANSSHHTLHIGPLAIDSAINRAMYNGREIKFTGSEFKLLNAIASGRGRAVSKAGLEEALGFGPEGKSVNIISVHIAHLRRKLEAEGIHGLILNENRNGYYLNPAYNKPGQAATHKAPAVRHLRRQPLLGVRGMFGRAVHLDEPAMLLRGVSLARALSSQRRLAQA